MHRECIKGFDILYNSWLAVANRARLLSRRRMDYVVLRVGGVFPERTFVPRRRFPFSLLPYPPPPFSVEALCDVLESASGDPRIQGVVLIISGLSAGPAILSSLRQAVARFRESGKRAIAYLHDLDMWSYYFACACDEVIAPESTSFLAAGFWSETVFFKDTLALFGIEADLEAIAEYKVSPDTFRRSTMTQPHREMLGSLLDSSYAEVMGAIAAGRRITVERAGEILDGVPLTAQQARDAGLLDGVCFEDELAAHLGTPDEPVALITLGQIHRQMVRPRRWYSRRAIGVIALEGMIVPGPSHQPPFPLPLPLPGPGEQAGSDTLGQQLRAAGRDRNLAAVVLYVDSPGGSATASDLIWREVAQLARTKPVVACMGNRAASGGYYVCASANAIIAQPMTLTGSIGIWGGKVVTRLLYEKLQAHREVVARGRMAGLYSDSAPFSDEERARIRAEIGAGYARFKARVAQGRGMSEEQVEALARGRVWTGRQGVENGLIDGLGDLHAAIEKARELAGIDPRRFAPVVNVAVAARALLPLPAASPADWIAGFSGLLREGIWALAPWEIRIR